MQVHRETIKEIPNALPNRTNPEVEIYGTEGIPEEDAKARAARKGDIDGKIQSCFIEETDYKI